MACGPRLQLLFLQSFAAPHRSPSKVLPLPSPLQTAVWAGKILRLTNSAVETLPVEVPGGWQQSNPAHPESSQGPFDFCTVYSQMLYQLSYSRNGWWPQATTSLFAISCCTSQESNIEKEEPPKSSRPAFSKALPSQALCKQRYGQARYQGWQTAQLKRCLWRCQEDDSRAVRPTRNRARDHLISAQSTARCSTNWAIAGMACGHRLQGAGWFRAFFLSKNSSTRLV